MVSSSSLKRRVFSAKRSFVTRRADLAEAKTLLTEATPSSGDLVLARVDSLGQHKRLELVTGRRAHLYEGDEIILAYADRYATDQFHGEVPEDLSPCHMVAAGGIAAQMISRNAKVKIASRITPIGLLGDENGKPLNLDRWIVKKKKPKRQTRPGIVVVVGSGMNAGKTTTVCSTIRMLKQSNLNVAAVKLTGTGSGGDLWHYQDSGADHTLDFTDAGYASTVGLTLNQLETLFHRLHGAVADKCDFAVMELADGIFQSETSALLQSPMFQSHMTSIIFAASDSMAAVAGTAWLRQRNMQVSAIAGAITASDLAVSELEKVTDIDVLTMNRFENDEQAINIALRSAQPVEAIAYERTA